MMSQANAVRADRGVLADEQEIVRVLHDCAAAYDAGRFDEVAGYFADGVWHVGPDAALTAGDVAAFLHGNIELYDGSPRTRHVISNVRVEVRDDGAAAHAESVVIVYQALPAGPIKILVRGAYHDDFVRTDRWRLAERRSTTDAVDGIETHIGST